MMIAAALLAASAVLEVTLLAGVQEIGDTAYHLIHLVWVAALAVSLFSLHLFARTRGGGALALWFGIGLCLTGVGDFINGAESGVEPATLKLSWALLLFGAGYAIYSVAMWAFSEPLLRGQSSRFARWRYAIPIPILIVNVIGWFTYVESHVGGHDVLYYGSFIFNATVNVALLTVAIWFFYTSGRSIGGLVVLIGALLLPYSDLILFDSWLRDGDPAVPSFELYSYNWIVYFSGQALISIFPALAIERRLNAQPGGEEAEFARP